MKEHTTKDDDDTMCYRSELEAAVKAAVAVERNKVAQWMIDRSYATGHGDTTEDLLKELEWQVADRCAEIANQAEPYQAADLIRKAFAVDPMPLFDDWPGGWKK